MGSWNDMNVVVAVEKGVDRSHALRKQRPTYSFKQNITNLAIHKRVPDIKGILPISTDAKYK